MTISSMTRRSLCAALAFACAGLLTATATATAQTYPTKPIRIVVGFEAGGGVDVAARLIAEKMTIELGQAVVVENRTGAGGSIATGNVASSAPDGYTLLFTAAPDTIVPAMRANLPYDLEKDFAHISKIADAALVLVVNNKVQPANIKELFEYAKANPGKLKYGSSGIGSSSHFAAELIKSILQLDMVHVPYKGSGVVMSSTIGGEVDFSFPTVAGVISLLQGGELKAYAITTATRSTLLPDVPTLAESGLPGYHRSSWYGMSAPAGTPKEIIDQLNAVLAKVVNMPDMKESFAKLGLEPTLTTPEEFAAFLHKDLAQNAELARSIGIKPE